MLTSEKCDILFMMNSVGEFSLSSMKERKPSKNTRTKDSLINAICCYLAARRASVALCHYSAIGGATL